MLKVSQPVNGEVRVKLRHFQLQIPYFKAYLSTDHNIDIVKVIVMIK